MENARGVQGFARAKQDLLGTFFPLRITLDS